jgi:thiamine-phosphate pyrophosphorylase
VRPWLKNGERRAFRQEAEANGRFLHTETRWTQGSVKDKKGLMKRSDADILWDVAAQLAREAAQRLDGRLSLGLPPLLFFTDPERTSRPWETAACLPAGSGVVFRHFGAPDSFETARRLREATRRRDGLLLIGLDADLAEAVGADGVHLPQRALGLAATLAARRPDWRLTGAVHDTGAMRAAAGLDAVVVSPVFPAGGRSSVKAALGVDGLKRLITTAPCPVYGLGGIDAGNATRLIGSGLCGLAGVAAIQSAFGPN